MSEYCLYALFFFVPLILTPLNYELFEYNKMMLTYLLTIMIVGSWAVHMIVQKKWLLFRTPFDIPLGLFVLSQILSTISSIDPHVSWWGYYSRFHGGLWSTLAYTALFYVLVAVGKTHPEPLKFIRKLGVVTLTSAVLVSIYGVLERLGIDKNVWVQDVQNRVFSTLGQPNWLAAYLTTLLPISIAIALFSIQKALMHPTKRIAGDVYRIPHNAIYDIRYTIYVLLPILFYSTLLFTKSRSGFIAFWITNAVFWLTLFAMHMVTWSHGHMVKKLQPFSNLTMQPLFKFFVIGNLALVILTFIIASPFPMINKYASFEIINTLRHKPPAQTIEATPAGTLLETGVTESGDIRRIVWKGAFEIIANYPLFGTGTETFAYAYYKHKPAEHNMTSEWDFLYNKAHNEYLNFAATTGLFGLGSYLLFIVWFIVWFLLTFKHQMVKWSHGHMVKKQKSSHLAMQPFSHFDPDILDTKYYILNTGLFAGWLSILITNFFGFSVVIVGIFFFLIPAVSFIISSSSNFSLQKSTISEKKSYTLIQKAALVFVLFYILYSIFYILKLWYADTVFAAGYRANRSGLLETAYRKLQFATMLNPDEPFYHDELSFAAASLAQALSAENEATIAAQFVEQALTAGSRALSISPRNVNFWKTRTRVLVTLGEGNAEMMNKALESILIARELAPTDAKIAYNAGLLYGRVNRIDEAIKTLQETTKLKPDFRDAYYALALFYKDKNNIEKARENLEFILNRLNPNDEEIKQLLEQL